MASAGLHLIHTERLLFARDGQWYADGEPVVHRRLAVFFSKHLRRKAGGGFEIWVDERFHSDCDVEDTPFVVRMIYGTSDGGFEIELNDESREPLDPASLSVGADDVLYCTVKNGAEKARLLRAAQAALASSIDAADGEFFLTSGGRRYPIACG